MNNDFVIAAESTVDIDRDWLDEHSIPIISYTFEADGEVIIDDCRPATRHAIYAKMRSGIQPNTSQITMFAYYEFFKKLLQEGKPVIFFDMDKALSSSYGNAVNAYNQIMEKMPEAKLTIVDTRCVTMGLALLLKKAVALKESGASYEEVAEYVQATKLKVAHRFLVDDLEWLRRGGRLSNASAIIGSLLAIKPVIYIPDDGTLVAHEKVRGKKHAAAKLLERTIEDVGDGEGIDFIVGHSDNPEEGERWKNHVMERFPKANSVELMELGPTIGCHVGPGFLSIVYITDTRRP